MTPLTMFKFLFLQLIIFLHRSSDVTVELGHIFYGWVVIKLNRLTMKLLKG